MFGIIPSGLLRVMVDRDSTTLSLYLFADMYIKLWNASKNQPLLRRMMPRFFPEYFSSSSHQEENNDSGNPFLPVFMCR
mgnify:FL=1